LPQNRSERPLRFKFAAFRDDLRFGADRRGYHVPIIWVGKFDGGDEALVATNTGVW
jgi:hypothetical protein